MPIISATALKGGVGKTTLVHHSAGALALSGRRVLAVDNDAQASLSSGMFGAAPSSRWTRLDDRRHLLGSRPAPRADHPAVGDPGRQPDRRFDGRRAVQPARALRLAGRSPDRPPCVPARGPRPVRRDPDRQPAEPPGRELGRSGRVGLPGRPADPRRLRVDGLSPSSRASVSWRPAPTRRSSCWAWC